MRVLLVDHDSEALEAIARAIRGVLELDCVTSKGDALLLLRQNTYDVLIACERCVDGSGLDLLGRTTRTTAPLKRLFAAPPDRLQLLGPRLAPFKVQRTINYPIDLEELWLAIAQVTGTSDDTDGTIERVVLDERGIPSAGTTPRAPIPASAAQRSPVPLREVRSVAPAPAPAIAVAAGARTAAARMAQPAPEPPVRPPPPARQVPPARVPAPPATASDTGRMRAPLPPATTSDTGRMRSPRVPAAVAPPPPPPETAGWTPPFEDDFAAVAAQARLGVERKGVDETARRRKQRLIVAGTAAVVVAGVIMVLIEKFYDPEARARERAIAAEVSRMAEQQKATDNLTLIEIDIEKAIMENQFDLARSELARLIELAPEHPRRDFLQSSIDRAAELARLAAQNSPPAARTPAPVERTPARSVEPKPERIARAPERRTDTARSAETSRASSTGASANARVYGAPLGEPLRQPTIALDAPINAPPSSAPARSAGNSSFTGRTVEAGDNSQTGVPTAPSGSPGPASGSVAAAPPAVTAPPAPAPAPAAVEVVPAKLVKRVMPVVSGNVPRDAEGFVVVSIEITEEGRVGSVAVIESSPRGVFDDAALTAVRKWQYEPRRENGVAVASQSRARLVFEAAN
jgi:TonB family protein